MLLDFCNNFYLDRELPVFTYCPNDILVKASSTEDSKQVSWQEPVREDNSGKVVLVYQSHKNPDTFARDMTTVVKYVVEDGVRNKATCEFFVKVECK